MENETKTEYERRKGWKQLTEQDYGILEQLAAGSHSHIDSVRVRGAIIARNGNTAYISSKYGAICYGCGIFMNNQILTERTVNMGGPKHKLPMLEALLSGAENLVLSHDGGADECGQNKTAQKIAKMYGIKNVYYSFAHFKTDNPEEYAKQTLSFEFECSLNE